VPLKIPRAVARFNRTVTNPIQGAFAWRLAPWAVICHRGRRSGRLYRTPVVAFRRHGSLAVVVMYGEESDWVRNVLVAGGAEVVRGGRTFPWQAVRLVDPVDGDAGLSILARTIGRITGRLVVGELGAPLPGRLRGPGA
jgi:deazaflavin-dependent oxidoreductase (nitroreductase family)